MRNVLIALAMVAPAVLAGCIGDISDGNIGVGPGSSTLPANAIPPVDLSTLIELDHDHNDASTHQFAWNIEDVGFTTGYLDGEEPAGGFTELALALPYVYLCRGGSAPGIVTIDASDPANPVTIGHFAAPRCDDIEVSHDGGYVFASMQRNRAIELTQPSDAPAKAPRGTYVLDASDPANLVFESFYPMPYNGPHTIQYHRYDDGREIVLHALYDLYGTTDPVGLPAAIPLEGSNPSTQRVEVAEFVALPDGTRGLQQIAMYQDLEGAMAEGTVEGTVRPHDMTVYTNPFDGHVYMLVAYWNGGVHIVNLDDPADPQFVSSFHDFAPSAYANVHLVRAFPSPIDGKWVLVAEPELSLAEEEAGQFTFIDATDPANPTKLGYWAIPGDVRILEPFLFSPHNFDLDDEGRMFLAHQHAGIWVVDVNVTGTFDAPTTLGVHWPVAPNGEVDGAARVWGVFLEDGLLWASDSTSGLHILEYVGP